tara:strand:- start:622 stop:825 length:204 start_codon:yes stop_codon:yes gene_type:complete
LTDFLEDAFKKIKIHAIYICPKVVLLRNNFYGLLNHNKKHTKQTYVYINGADMITVLTVAQKNLKLC